MPENLSCTKLARFRRTPSTPPKALQDNRQAGTLNTSFLLGTLLHSACQRVALGTGTRGFKPSGHPDGRLLFERFPWTHSESMPTEKRI